MNFQRGDFVEFTGVYTGADGRPLEPKNPTASITVDGETTDYEVRRTGKGEYRFETTFTAAGETTVRFAGEIAGRQEVYSEETFEVTAIDIQRASGSVMSPDQTPPRYTTPENPIRDMMLADLRAAGFGGLETRTDAAIAGAHAELKRRQADAKRPKINPLPSAPQRPLPLSNPSARRKP